MERLWVGVLPDSPFEVLADKGKTASNARYMSEDVSRFVQTLDITEQGQVILPLLCPTEFMRITKFLFYATIFVCGGMGGKLLLCSNRNQNRNSHPLSSLSKWPWIWRTNPGLQKRLEFSLTGPSATWFFLVCELILLVP